MISFALNIETFITKELLYYAWLDLKLKRKYFFYYFDLFFLDPLNKSWFEKSSNLLKKGSYEFSNLVILNKINNFSRRRVFKLIKAKVLENTFFFLFLLHLSVTISLKNMNLTECLCLCLSNIICKFVLSDVSESLSFLTIKIKYYLKTKFYVNKLKYLICCILNLFVYISSLFQFNKEF